MNYDFDREPISRDQLEKLSDQEIRDLYHQIIAMWNDPKTHDFVVQGIKKAREHNR